MKCASSYVTSDTNIIVTLSKVGQDIRAHIQLITLIVLFILKIVNARKLWLPLKILICFEREKINRDWIELGSDGKHEAICECAM